MDNSSTIRIGTKQYHFPLIKGTEDESAIDISHLRSESSVITYDEGYVNTGFMQKQNHIC